MCIIWNTPLQANDDQSLCQLSSPPPPTWSPTWSPTTGTSTRGPTRSPLHPGCRPSVRHWNTCLVITSAWLVSNAWFFLKSVTQFRFHEEIQNDFQKRVKIVRSRFKSNFCLDTSLWRLIGPPLGPHPFHGHHKTNVSTRSFHVQRDAVKDGLNQTQSEFSVQWVLICQNFVQNRLWQEKARQCWQCWQCQKCHKCWAEKCEIHSEKETTISVSWPKSCHHKSFTSKWINLSNSTK